MSQRSFRPGYRCIDQIFTLRALAEKAREFNTPLYLAFVDLHKIYNSINKEVLWLVLQGKYHLPSKLVWNSQALHRGTRGAVRAYGRV